MAGQTQQETKEFEESTEIPKYMDSNCVEMVSDWEHRTQFYDEK